MDQDNVPRPKPQSSPRSANTSRKPWLPSRHAGRPDGTTHTHRITVESFVEPGARNGSAGPRAGFPELFDSRWTLLTPLEGGDPEAEAKLRALWEGMGSFVESMDANHHDLVLAVTSHAPHLIAYTMVGVADDLRRVTDSEVIKYSAAGFRDFTRIAASDPTMWRDVFLSNKDATLEILGRFTEELFALQRAIRTGDGEHLHSFFTRTREIRRGIIEAGQDTDAPDFGRRPKSSS